MAHKPETVSDPADDLQVRRRWGHGAAPWKFETDRPGKHSLENAWPRATVAPGSRTSRSERRKKPPVASNPNRPTEWLGATGLQNVSLIVPRAIGSRDPISKRLNLQDG